MQALWSRAAQAQASCHCRMCLHSTNALTRRATTAAPRRRVTAADIFTACYTTILGTAALIDARHKNERRQELDEKLGRARAALKQLDNAVDGKNGASQGPISSSSGEIPAYLQPKIGSESDRPLLEELRSICNATYRPKVRQSWMRDQVEWVNIEAAVAAEEFDPKVSFREPVTHKDLEHTTTSILDLVDELLQLTRISSSQQVKGEVPTPHHVAEGIITELVRLRRGREFPSYQFPTADGSYTAYVRAYLNRSIRRIFHQAVTSRETVARICYNLITSGVPPTVHTYNTLIVGFNRMQRPDLAQAVINSYLDSKICSATQQTAICLLNHYRRPGGKEGMREVVQRMRLDWDDGGQLSTSHNDRVRLAREHKWPKAKRTDPIFDHLIRGWLYHEEVGIACMTFVAGLRHSASIPIYTIRELFRSCLATADFSSARKLLAGIAQNFERFKAYLAWIIKNNTITVLREVLQGLHQIITICWLPFGEIWGETYQTYATAAISLEAIISHLDAQLEIQEEAQRAPSEPTALDPFKMGLAHLGLTLSSLDRARLSTRTLTESERVYARIAMRLSIEKRLSDLEEQMQSISAAFNAAIIGIKTGHDFDETSVLFCDKGGRIFENQRLAARRALGQLDASDDSLTIEDIASRLFREAPNKDLTRPLEEYDNWKRLSISTLISFFGSDPVSSTPDQGEELSQSYLEVEKQCRAATESIHGLIFAHLTTERQLKIMYRENSYHEVSTKKLSSRLHLALRYKLPAILQTSYESQYNEFSDTYDTPASLLQLGREEPTPIKQALPAKADNTAPDTRWIEDTWGAPYKHKEQDPLDIFREEGLCLENTAVG
ncbi:hypothetical protein F5Y03DRAFT_153738 [Xylaria venustula]|nr:hypothetical protein F5Y03DRAFT_153738 [Xylaria venustula]